jgi:3-hydroxymyristoyl/3-hydroxydecanoyl-(acyl carrier protein) dehydratase
MSSGIDELGFDGVPFDALETTPQTGPAPTAAPQPGAAGPTAAAALVAEVVGQLRSELLVAHRAAVQVQQAWQESALRELRGGTPGVAPAAPSGGVTGGVRLAPAAFRPEGALEPLAPALVTALAPEALERLRHGELAAVLGPRHERGEPGPALGAGPLRAVTELRPGGPVGVGVLRGSAAAPAGDDELRALGVQVAQVLAGWLGLPTVVPVARFGTLDAGRVEATPLPAGPAPDGTVEVLAEVTAADLLPRPWVRVDVELRAGGRSAGLLRGVAVEVREEPGTPLGTRCGGNPPALPVRRGVTGELAVVDELALATASLGDLVPALGPEFARYAEVRATRPPAGGLRLIGRVMAIAGTRGQLAGGATGETEYDSAADAWYYGAAPSQSVPNVVLMETSLQSALLLGYHLGATLTDPDEDYSLRNLDGAATLHREVDLRGRTICQRSELLSTTVLTGAVLQSFSYALWLDGEDRAETGPFYSGQSLFGFFNASALANQTGLDNGTYVPSWLDRHPEAGARTVTVGGRTGAPRASGELDLIARMEVVDGGGAHGRGYLRARRAVAESDWFFARHFHLDPVMPGSLGVEAVIQALQEWLVDAGALDGLADPEFVVPAGLELHWRYRGQILAADGEMTLEAHVKQVERRPGRVRVVADAAVWKPGLRIYELTDVAAEAREKGAPSW